jgi:hypothetical protein
MPSCPVVAYKLVEHARYKSVAEAARCLGVRPNAVREAVERGHSCRDLKWRYADMPVECQPLDKPVRRRCPVVWEGVRYESILAASGGDRAKYMRIWYALKRANSKQEGGSNGGN